MRSKIIVVFALAFALCITLAGALTSPVQAASVSISISKTSAVPGQWIVVKGRAPVNKRQKVTLIRTLYNAEVQTKYTSKNGAYSFRFRMASMPKEGYKVRLASGKSSSTRYVTSIRQDVTVNANGNRLEASVFPGMVRPMTLQKRVSPTQWESIASANSNSNGNVTFSIQQGLVYRVVAGGVKDISTTYSLPWVTELPDLAENYTELNEPGKVYNPQPDSGRSAASKYSWWPAGMTWDWEDGLGMQDWTNYSTGSGRGILTYGGLWQASGLPGSRNVSFGDLSSTYTKKSFGVGNWEFKSRTVQRGESFTPYTARYSLVPAGTPDGVEPAQEIIVAEYSGYGTSHQIGVRDGSYEYMKTVNGWTHNSQNWHAYGLQVTNKRITWIVNSKPVGSWKRTPAFSGKLVPRLELISKQGERMTTTTLATDWIRYFELKPGANISAATTGFSKTPLASARPTGPAPKKLAKPASAPKVGVAKSVKMTLNEGF